MAVCMKRSIDRFMNKLDHSSLFIPAYRNLQWCSAQHSGNKVSDVPGVFIVKRVSLFFHFLMGKRVLRMEEAAIIALLPKAPIRAQTDERIFSLNLAPG